MGFAQIFRGWLLVSLIFTFNVCLNFKLYFRVFSTFLSSFGLRIFPLLHERLYNSETIRWILLKLSELWLLLPVLFCAQLLHFSSLVFLSNERTCSSAFHKGGYLSNFCTMGNGKTYNHFPYHTPSPSRFRFQKFEIFFGMLKWEINPF